MEEPIKRAAAERGNPSESFLKNGGPLYRRRGKPERVWAEIRRQILQKLHTRIQKERLLADAGKDRSADNELNTKHEAKRSLPQ